MNKKDEFFGILSYNSRWYRKYNLSIFGKCVDVVLEIQTFDEDEITAHQRKTFSAFEERREEILSDIEQSVRQYYKENFGLNEDAGSNVEDMVQLLKIKVMWSDPEESRDVGLIFDADFDPELGVGVLVSNEKVKEVDVQDIVLG